MDLRRRDFLARGSVATTLPCPAGTAFIPDQAEAERGSIMFLCAGRNGIELEDSAETLMLTARAGSYLTGSPRYMIAGSMPDRAVHAGMPEHAVYERLNATLQSRTVRHISISRPRRPRDIAVGVYPAGMFQDATHLTRSGQAIWAARVAARVKARGWA